LVGGCSGGTTITKIETVPQACGPDTPFGVCASGQRCFEGACVEAASLCSPTNLTGTCTAGTSCFAGGCVLPTALCSTTNATGACDVGNSCFEGACVATGSLCSSVNTSGACASGKQCVDGACVLLGEDPCKVVVYTTQPTIGVDTRAKLTVDGKEFKDSNGNGSLDVYEDWRLSEICRARDLVTKMSVAQKIGLMSEGSTIGGGTADGVISQNTKDNLQKLHLRQALIRLGGLSARELAIYLNNIQKLVEAEPLGIPFVVTADPVHGFGMSTNATTGAQTIGPSSVVTPWPYPLGLGAANDVTLTRAYGELVRREFMAMGFRWQLGPMADLATEPRWDRVQNTFGETPQAVAAHTRACITGFQNGVARGSLKNGIASTMKHFPGAGTNQDGLDSHNWPGRYNVFPGNNFFAHQIPFKAAIEAGAAAVMPCYSIMLGQIWYSDEQTAVAYNYGLVTRYMKQELGFDGMVTGDWGVIGTKPFGVEGLSLAQRAALFVKAGSHQLGSDSIANIKAAFDQGFLAESDLDGAAEKILEMSFKLGIFENPYTDPAASALEARSQANLLLGFEAQKKAIVILRNQEHSVAPSFGGSGQPSNYNGVQYLPISGSRRVADGGVASDSDRDNTVEVYFDGVTDGLSGTDIYDPALQAYNYAEDMGTTADGGVKIAITSVTDPAQADIAVARITSRKGTYSGLDKGVPLSFDAPFAGTWTDTFLAQAIKDRNRVIDLLRIRDGYRNAAGEQVAATNPTLKIVLVMHVHRPGILKPFVNGLVSLDEVADQPGSYPLVSDEANILPFRQATKGVDGVLVEFGAYDRAVLDVLFNKNVPTSPAGYRYGGKLPLEIPSSDAEVEAQFEDLPADSLYPTYRTGDGLTF
jgi:beta-glucosidase